jgi:hypothetical protein
VSVRRGISWILLFTAVWGCSDGEEAELEAASAMCRGLCTAALRCVDGAPLPVCVENCKSDWWSASRTDPAAAQRLGTCYEDFTCSEVIGDEPVVDEAFERCWVATQLEVVATPELRALCAEYSSRVFDCGSWLSTERCEQIFGMWAPAVHDEMRSCFGESECEGLNSCIDEVFEP